MCSRASNQGERRGRNDDTRQSHLDQRKHEVQAGEAFAVTKEPDLQRLGRYIKRLRQDLDLTRESLASLASTNCMSAPFAVSRKRDNREWRRTLMG